MGNFTNIFKSDPTKNSSACKHEIKFTFLTYFQDYLISHPDHHLSIIITNYYNFFMTVFTFSIDMDPTGECKSEVLGEFNQS